MSTIAERLDEDAPKRLTPAHVEALLEAELARKEQAKERALRDRKRQERIERERRVEASKHADVAAAMRKVAGR